MIPNNIWKKTCAFLALFGILITAPGHTETTFDSTIPVVDINDFYQPETHDQFVAQIASALKEVGFFAVINSGVDGQTLDKAYEAAQQFFQLDMETKLLSHNPNANGQRGYIPGESAKGSAFGDFKEFYHVGREGVALCDYPNIWPDHYPLKEPLNTLFDALEICKIPLEQAMCEAIGQPLDFLTQMTQDGECLLRAIHYPANPPEDRLWAAAHTDIDLFTILPRATAEGLQVLNKEGEWIDVRVPENAFIINGGDMLENLTNGMFKSSQHRVVANSKSCERYSMVIFIHPKAADRLDPLPQCINTTGGIRKYAHATRWELLEERLADLGLASPAMLEHLATCGIMERLIEVKRASPKAMNRLKDAGLANEAILGELARIELEGQEARADGCF
jgi:isopenicillin N synthase-like dioxygenase